MDASFRPPPAVVQAVLLIFALVPPLSRLAFSLLRHTLRKYWRLYSEANPVKQDKSVRNFLKSLIYLFVFTALLPISTRMFKFWVSNSFMTPIPTFNLNYVRILLALVPAYYVFELITTEPFDLFIWLHHGIVIIMVPIVVTAALTKTSEDASYLTNVAIFVGQTFSANFILFCGHAVARILPYSKKRYRLLFFLAVYPLILTVILLIIVWVYFAASARRLSNWVPVLMTVVTAVGISVDNVHASRITLSMAMSVRNRIKKEQTRLEEASV